MSKKTTLLTVVIAAVLLLAVVAIAMNAPNKPSADEATSETTQQAPATETENSTDEEQQVAATITYTDDGFDPSTLTVKSGDTVRVENRSSSEFSLNSGDHPTHTKASELNVGEVPQNGSRTFTMTKRGTWPFHNHNNPTHEGMITVE